MNRDRSKGQWKQLTGQVGAQWEQLDDDVLDRLEGQHEPLVAKPNKRYSIAEEEAELRLRSKSTRSNEKWPKS